MAYMFGYVNGDPQQGMIFACEGCQDCGMLFDDDGNEHEPCPCPAGDSYRSKE